MAPNFNAILTRLAFYAEAPKPLTIGTYVWVVKGMPELGESSKKKTPQMDFKVVPIQALDDVDQEDLDAALTKKSGGKSLLGDKSQRLTFYLTDDAEWRLTRFWEHLGLETEGKSHQELMGEANGCQFLGTIGHDASDDGENVYAKIKSTAKAEE